MWGGLTGRIRSEQYKVNGTDKKVSCVGRAKTCDVSFYKGPVVTLQLIELRVR